MDRKLRGRRVRVVHCSDPYTSLPAGTLGTIQFMDDLGTLHAHWDNGSRLGLVPHLDRWEVLPEEPIQQRQGNSNE